MAQTSLLYKRVLLKISGEILAGDFSRGNFHSGILQLIALDIKRLVDGGAEVSIDVGGGNIFRGANAEALGIERATGDYMGMLATVMNAIALQSTLEYNGIVSRVMSAIPMSNVCEPYIRLRALRHLERGRVVIFAAGTGNPFMTTDTAAALRASEMQCDVLAKGTKVSGIFDSDPQQNPDAKRLELLSYHTALSKNLRVMDAAALSICSENDIPIIVFSLLEGETPLTDVICGQGDFSKVSHQAGQEYTQRQDGNHGNR